MSRRPKEEPNTPVPTPTCSQSDVPLTAEQSQRRQSHVRLTTRETGTEPSAQVLVVDDDAHARRAIARLLPAVTVVPCASVAEAQAFIDAAIGIAGAIIDLGLPDGSGLEVAAAVRHRWPRVPILVVTGQYHPCVIASVQRFGAEFLCKPAPPENIQAYVDRALGSDPIHRLAERHGLSPREAEVLRLLVAGVPRKQVPSELGLSPHTVRTYERRIVDKTVHDSVTALVQAIWIGEGDHSV